MTDAFTSLRDEQARKKVVNGRVTFAFPAGRGSKVEFRGFAGGKFVSVNVLTVP